MRTKKKEKIYIDTFEYRYFSLLIRSAEEHNHLLEDEEERFTEDVAPYVDLMQNFILREISAEDREFLKESYLFETCYWYICSPSYRSQVETFVEKAFLISGQHSIRNYAMSRLNPSVIKLMHLKDIYTIGVINIINDMKFESLDGKLNTGAIELMRITEDINSAVEKKYEDVSFLNIEWRRQLIRFCLLDTSDRDKLLDETLLNLEIKKTVDRMIQSRRVLIPKIPIGATTKEIT